MTRDEQAMLAFATRWLPYCGGDEHIFPEFGLSPAEFYRRVFTLVDRRFVSEVDFATKQQLREFCLMKLAQRPRMNPGGS
ncbi:DUF3263 domain-containing protein [Rhodococcus tibetensis]|uniref:DUF3263 domain-containing protein n=1 Tax=Rhodococcus tibetensis TaxID=2965064 RepID=A0ABT1QNL9_9NOCA|nr:DUF3263 domain-containing protein [Rhodococcus sp. FXJ9.536]MCQ4122785.1 DUF3263 domain-containing protein [Rhodococcus sp. FXJ9.536]